MLNSVLEYQVPIAPTAEPWGVSQRHTRRLLAACREHGAAALTHGNRGRRPHNAIPANGAAAVAELATQRYQGANHTYLTELPWEREDIDLSRPVDAQLPCHPSNGRARVPHRPSPILPSSK